MISAIISRIVILLFGTLYPGYASYKAIRTKNVKEYVKWMMYWIVFALFSCIETFTDIFLVWFPFYYEFKIIIVLWLLSPTTKGSSTLYRKFVHPMLIKREEEIDEYINHAKETGYKTVLHFGSKGVNYATNVIMQTAIKTIESIPVSRSDHSLDLHRDYVDSTDRGMTRSMSVGFKPSPPKSEPTYSTESSDELNNDPDYEGTARSRLMPQRKTTSTRTVKPVKPRAVRGRVNLRKPKSTESSEIDVLQ